MDIHGSSKMCVSQKRAPFNSIDNDRNCDHIVGFGKHSFELVLFLIIQSN